MKRVLAFVSVAAVSWLGSPKPAEACGGCFVPPAANTQVTGHRMILTASKTQSTLYDQIQYTGEPEEFAWVLPIKGTVEVGISSDLVFNQLDFDTAIAVLPPPSNCPVYDCGYNEDGALAASSGTGGQSGGDGGVEVLAQEVVGPYETVQLAATDPNALNDWLASHAYNVPSDIQPIITSYVSNNFNFLAMKLVPGVGVDKMKPVRITTQGASPVLPLKMVAAGTGQTTTVTLYVIGEGRYEPANFPGFTIAPDAVIWDYDTQSSNYELLRTQAYTATNGFGWLIEAARAYSPSGFHASILNVVDFVGPVESGYADDPNDYEGAHMAAEEDLAVMFAGLNETSVKITRMRAELSRPALGSDLTMSASDDQTDVSNVVQTTKWKGTQPACAPPPPGCDDPTVSYPNGKPQDDTRTPGQNSSCAMGDRSSPLGATALGGLAILVMLAIRYRRRR
jgi:hypothetical protein